MITCPWCKRKLQPTEEGLIPAHTSPRDHSLYGCIGIGFPVSGVGDPERTAAWRYDCLTAENTAKMYELWHRFLEESTRRNAAILEQYFKENADEPR